MFSFAYDPEKVLLSVVQEGYWTLPEFREYEREFTAIHDRIRKIHKSYRVISDCRNYPVQSTEVGEAFFKFFEKLMSENKGHYAIIVASMLNKIQAKRAIPQTNVQTFMTLEEATAWVFEDGSLPD